MYAKYFRGSSTDELVAGYLYDTDAKLKPFLFHHDNVNSVSQVSGHNGGTLQATTFSAFGSTQSTTGTSPNRLKYTGREDDGTGLYYYRARYYDPAIGRFISEDPLGFAAGDVNFYAYVGNNPVNHNDPSGQILPAIATAIESAPVWVPPLVNFARTAWAATTTLLRTNPGVVAGTIGGTSGAAGYVATTPNPTVRGTVTAGGVSAVQGVLSVYAPGAGTFLQGATIGGAGNTATQLLNIAQGTQTGFNYTELGFATFGGGAATKLTGPFLPANAGWSQQAAAATISFPVQTGFSAVGQRLGAPSPEFALQNFNDFGSPSLDFPTFAGLSGGFGYLNLGGSAGGGFLLYPNKANTNMMRSVYAK